MRTIIEIGANVGEITRQLLDGRSRVFAFEPVPEMAQRLRERFSHTPGFHCVEMAVDLRDGERLFHVSAQNDRAASSLYEFNPVVSQDVDPAAYQHAAGISVPTVRLDTFMKAQEIETLDLLWIEGEGNDFRILQSLGERADNVREGRCEGVYQRPLHAGAENDHVRIVKWLQLRGFEVALLPDLMMMNVAIHFRTRSPAGE